MPGAGQPLIMPGEGRKVGIMALAMCLLAHWRRKTMRRRWLPKDVAEDDDRCHLVDHPAVVYLLENGACFGVAYLLEKHFPAVDIKRPLYTFIVLLVKGWLMVNPLLLFEKFSASYIYSHVKYFSGKKPPQDLATIVREYLRCNFPVDIANAAMQLAVLHGTPVDRRKALIENPPPMSLGLFAIKYVISRLAVDVVFGVAHRIMHENQWIYDNIHKTHHEHTTPRTQTNLHFTWLDLFLEAVMPMYVAFGFLEAVGLGPTTHELTFLGTPLLYYESSSHSGKEVPTVTWIPFLSPLVDWLTGSDQRLIEYHTRHHQLYKCNYSISPWWDKLLGTYRIELPNSYNKEGSYE